MIYGKCLASALEILKFRFHRERLHTFGGNGSWKSLNRLSVAWPCFITWTMVFVGRFKNIPIVEHYMKQMLLNFSARPNWKLDFFSKVRFHLFLIAFRTSIMVSQELSLKGDSGPLIAGDISNFYSSTEWWFMIDNIVVGERSKASHRGHQSCVKPITSPIMKIDRIMKVSAYQSFTHLSFKLIAQCWFLANKSMNFSLVQ